eukprot:scaffold7639_cov258-Pinguiococcus_pyrenoidosus.AAC.2
MSTWSFFASRASACVRTEFPAPAHLRAPLAARPGPSDSSRRQRSLLLRSKSQGRLRRGRCEGTKRTGNPPSAAKILAVALPMPLVAPVITAALPLSRPLGLEEDAIDVGGKLRPSRDDLNVWPRSSSSGSWNMRAWCGKSDAALFHLSWRGEGKRGDTARVRRQRKRRLDPQRETVRCLFFYDSLDFPHHSRAPRDYCSMLRSHLSLPTLGRLRVQPKEPQKLRRTRPPAKRPKNR